MINPESHTLEKENKERPQGARISNFKRRRAMCAQFVKGASELEKNGDEKLEGNCFPGTSMHGVAALITLRCDIEFSKEIFSRENCKGAIRSHNK